LSDLLEAQPKQDRHHFARFQNWNIAHSRNSHGLRTNELGLQHWLTVFEQHRDHFFQITA
jgi:hypothetical protein